MRQTIIKSEPSNAARARRFSLGIASVLLLLTALAVLPFFVIGEDQKIGCCGGAMPVTHDSWMHYNQMQAFWRGLASGRVYPRWDDATHSYGAPIFSFYPPGVYYVTSAVYVVTGDWARVWVGFYGLMMLGSAAAIYWYARPLMRRAAAVLATAVYVFAPYHLINQYQRGALAEYASFVWMPLALGFAERLLPDDVSRRMRWRQAASLAAVCGAFLWTHPPTAYQFTLVFGSCLTIAALKRGQWRGVLWMAAALVFGSLLAAAYFYPAIGEQHLVNYDNVEHSWPYHASYVFDFAQQTYDRAANPFFTRLDYIWAFSTLAILLAATVFLSFKRGRDSERLECRLQPAGAWRKLPAEAGALNTVGWCDALRARVWLWATAGLLASFLMTKYSAPLGGLIPKIEIGVFSWRMLTITSLTMALLTGACVSVRSPAFRRQVVATKTFPPKGGTTNVAIALVILLGALVMSARFVAWPMWRGQSFAPNPEHFNYATLPRTAVVETLPLELAQTASGQGGVTINRWQPEFRQVLVEVQAPDQLQLRTYNFAGWTALRDGQAIPINTGAVGNIVVDLPPGRHQLTFDFRSTPLRRASNWLTIFSSAVLLVVVVFTRRRK